MQRYAIPAGATCSCGAVKVGVHRAIARFYCHCTICQRLNDAPYGDPVVAFRWDIEIDHPEQLAWKRHRWTPLNVNRGACRSCDTLIVEHIAASPLSIVVGRTWTAAERLPPSVGHAFYETRVADVDDGLPKWSGYVPSELAMSWWIARGLFRREPGISALLPRSDER